MASIHQQHVATYHRSMAAHGHAGGHDMYTFHREWHRANRDPRPPPAPNPTWGTNLVYGTNFLQMHHEMVKATPDESHFHMMHDSVAAWYIGQGIPVPAAWRPMEEIPAQLGYEPDVSVFPDDIQEAVTAWAAEDEVSVEQWLTRRTDQPRFELPKWFTRDGVGVNERGEPITGARKLADFKNTNQLGCCIVFPHNAWHGRIGGAMGSTWTAIADPIFYFGVHWHIDRVFDEFKAIQAERRIRRLDVDVLRVTGAMPSAAVEVSDTFTREEQEEIAAWVEQSRRLHREPR